MNYKKDGILREIGKLNTAEEVFMLEVNQNAPLTIPVVDMNGKKVSLGDFSGDYVVVYFYPKDSTPGCTKEACSFRDYTSELSKLGVKVVGISKDSSASHQKFIEKNKLNFPLWSDSEHQLMEAFGVWEKKSFMGKEYMGTTRSTFVLDPKGKIIKVWPQVKPLNHAEEVWQFLYEYIKNK